MNVSTVPDELTASTSEEVARQRADALCRIDRVESVLELCVGPSFRTLYDAYAAKGIVCFGNDIEERWQPNDKELNFRWVQGDAMQLSYDRTPYDAVVFAPPLSRGCTGKREDALRVDQVQPDYVEFIKKIAWTARPPTFVVLVLPGRSLSTKRDHEATYKVVSHASAIGIVELQERIVGGVMKYLDIVICLDP